MSIMWENEELENAKTTQPSLNLNLGERVQRLVQNEGHRVQWCEENCGRYALQKIKRISSGSLILSS